jgi:hypothetical protein
MLIQEQDRAYKRGLVLGLTMAEIIILIPTSSRSRRGLPTSMGPCARFCATILPSRS